MFGKYPKEIYETKFQNEKKNRLGQLAFGRLCNKLVSVGPGFPADIESKK